MKLSFGLSCILFLLYPLTSFANVRLDKYLVVFEGTQRNDSLYISNSEMEIIEPKRYSVDFVNYKQMPDGSYVEIKAEDERNKFADRFLIISPRRFTIEPGGSQILKIYRKPIDPSFPDGEYRSHLRIQEIPTQSEEKKDVKLGSRQFSFEITGIYGITIPIIIKKGQNVESDTATITNLKYFTENNKHFLHLTINRSGLFPLLGKIIVKDEKDNEVARVDSFNVFRSTDSRDLKIEINEKKLSSSAKKLNIKVIDSFKDKVLSSDTLDIKDR